MSFFSKLFGAQATTDPLADLRKTEYDVLLKMQKRLEKEVHDFCAQLNMRPPMPIFPPCYSMREGSSKRYYEERGIKKLQELIALHKTLSALVPNNSAAAKTPKP